MGMGESKKAYYIKDWIVDLQKRGRITFTKNEVDERFAGVSSTARRNALHRLVTKGEIVSVWRGFYVIVPLKYATRKMVPPVLYIDNLMKHMSRPYYVGLLNAAALHGAAHQQPQEFFVLSPPPALRDTEKKGVRINFLVRKEIPETLLQSFKTETGYVMVSSPELTAADLITYQKEVGGLNRVATVLNELAESFGPDSWTAGFFANVPVTTVQRMGYLLEAVLGFGSHAEALFTRASKSGLRFQRIPLKSGSSEDGFEMDGKWRVIINETIEIDE